MALKIYSRTLWNGWSKRVKTSYAKYYLQLMSILSIPVKRHREKQGEPSSKAKYAAGTDSELVP
jgi:hypothetical protein